MPVTLPSLIVPPHLRRGDDPALRLYRVSLEERAPKSCVSVACRADGDGADGPMRAARRDGEGGRVDEHLGADATQAQRQLGEAQVVADLQAEGPEGRGEGRGQRGAGLDGAAGGVSGASGTAEAATYRLSLRTGPPGTSTSKRWIFW